MARPIEPAVEVALLEYGIVDEQGSYGIRIEATTKHGHHSRTVHRVTDDLQQASRLLERLWRNGVSPVNVQDILDDLRQTDAANVDKRDFLDII